MQTELSLSTGRVLKRLRAVSKIKQISVASQLGITQSAYSNYESGRRTPDIEMLYRISRYFGISLDVLAEMVIMEKEQTAESGLSIEINTDDRELR